MDGDFLLLRRMQNGDDQAIESFVRKYYPKILRYCHLHIKDSGFAEDLTQETFARFFRTLHQYQHYGKAANYLYVIAGNLCRDYYRKPEELPMEELPEHPVYVNTDKGRMEQVLNNLIVNAKRNNRPGGILKLSLLEKDGLLDFSIFNQGPPIPEESLSKIWSKFYRDKNSKYSGSGLGLAIVAQVLSMQHLHYGAENQPGGVAFYFSLPTVK